MYPYIPIYTHTHPSEVHFGTIFSRERKSDQNDFGGLFWHHFRLGMKKFQNYSSRINFGIILDRERKSNQNHPSEVNFGTTLV